MHTCTCYYIQEEKRYIFKIIVKECIDLIYTQRGGEVEVDRALSHGSAAGFPLYVCMYVCLCVRSFHAVTFVCMCLCVAVHLCVDTLSQGIPIHRRNQEDVRTYEHMYCMYLFVCKFLCKSTTKPTTKPSTKPSTYRPTSAPSVKPTAKKL